MTYKKLIEKYNITLELHRIPFRTDISDEWAAQAKHFTYKLSCNGNSIRGCYSQGSGVKGGPSTIDILNALRVDTEGIQGIDFETWAGDFGYDSDSIKALGIYKACLDESKNLKKLLGNGLSELYDCEQL